MRRTAWPLLVGALVLIGGATGAGAQADRGRSGITVVAAGGQRVGPMVGFQVPLLNSAFALPIVPHVAIDEGGRLFTLGVLRDRLVGSQGALFFESTDCSGPPLLPSHGDVFSQSLVRAPGLTVFLEKEGRSPTDVAIQSRLVVDPFTGTEGCEPDSFISRFVPALPLSDLSTRFPPPYTVR